MEPKKQLLDVAGLRGEYGLARDVAYALAKRLPHVRVGTRYLVRRADVDDFLSQAAHKRCDLRAELKAPAMQGGAEG
ncbi:hypothetical protein [Meiothermus cerbereus]|uniref:hypothetical protein n=1 Tax=Meiothermus cerbereus TaxID=65552 RepID=UPI000AC98AE0|nr:hypothetical protein [Meiothermus cerbereus]